MTTTSDVESNSSNKNKRKRAPVSPLSFERMIPADAVKEHILPCLDETARLKAELKKMRIENQQLRRLVCDTFNYFSQEPLDHWARSRYDELGIGAVGGVKTVKMLCPLDSSPPHVLESIKHYDEGRDPEFCYSTLPVGPLRG